MKIVTYTENKSLDKLKGKRPILDTFVATLAITKVQYPDSLSDWFKSIKIYPAFIFYKEDSYYRIFGIHNLLPNPAEDGISDSVLHVAVYENDFMINFLSRKSFFQTDLYEFIPVFATFFPSEINKLPPIGGQLVKLNNSFYLRLFHFTTKKGKSGIQKERILRSSQWNFAGTKKIGLSYCYFTDMYHIDTMFDSLPILIRKSGSTDIIFRTDDEKHLVESNVNIENRELDEKLSFLIKCEIIQPNPVIMHHPIKGQTKWLEIEFQRIYRIPCDYIKLINKTIIDGDEHWIIDENCLNALRNNDPIMIADGNNPKSLNDLINENHIK